VLVKTMECGFAMRCVARYQGGMLRPAFLATLLVITVLAGSLQAVDQQVVPVGTMSPSQTNAFVPSAPAPMENRYDVLSKMITPMAGVLLGGTQTGDRALTLKATVDQVAGRLPQVIKGATFTAKIQYPGRIRVEAPVMGETLTVCRDGDQVWAVPGAKIQFLLGQFKQKPHLQPKNAAPLQLPFSAQQAVLLPALFQLQHSQEVADIGGSSCRIISGGLIPEVAKAANAEDFSAKLWICSEYVPKRIDIRRSDFAMSFLIGELTYCPEFPASTWQPPVGAKDIYRCDAAQLQQLLYVLMNSLQMGSQDKPWMSEPGAATNGMPLLPSAGPRFTSPLVPAN